MKCKIKNCLSENNVNVSFFCVPFNSILRKKWIHSIEKYQEFDYSITVYRICEKHFQPQSLVQQNKRKKLVAGAIPSIFP